MEETIVAPTQTLDFGRCLNEAVDVWKKNWLVLALAALIVVSVSAISFFILAGPLAGGVAVMTLQALRRPDKTVVLGDMFRDFAAGRFVDRLLPLVGLFFLSTAAIILGLFVCVVPGLFLLTVWFYSFLLMVDHDLGVFASLRVSKEVVMYNGFWMNLAIVAVVAALEGASATPYIGLIISCIGGPLCWLITAAAYIQQVDNDSGLVRNLIKAEQDCADVGV